MLCGSVLTMYCVENYKNLKKEGYTAENDEVKMEQAKNMVLVAFVVFFIELVLLFYAITTAIYWPVGSTLERFVHVFFAVFLTIPYILVTIIAKLARPSTAVVLCRSGNGSKPRSRRGSF